MGIEDYDNSRNFCGIITSGNRKSRCDVSFDVIPDDHEEVHIRRRSIISVVDTDKEEKEHDHMVEECNKIEDKE